MMRLSKYCIVPMCHSSSVKTPDKARNLTERVRWCKAMKRCTKKNTPLSEKTCRHVCEDHFDLENDMENYIRYKLMGGRIFLKRGVLPHRFDCQTSKKETVTASTERAAEKWSRKSRNRRKQKEAGPSNVKPPYMLKESKMLVNVAYFVKSLQSLNNHGGDGCNFSDMYITGETTIDCNVGIEFSCAICLTTAFVWTDDPGPEFLEQHPPKPFTPPPKKTPVIAEKVPTKPRRKKTPPPPTRPPRVPRLKSIRQGFVDYYTSNSIDYQFPNDVPFIKQEVPEDDANLFLNQLPLLSTQPATVQLLFGVENANDVPQSLDKNVSLSPGTDSWNHQTLSVTSLNTGHSVMTSANETIVPDVRLTEALPVDLNLVKAEIQKESQSMEVDNLPSVRILPMSVTSINRSETAFASESFTKTSKDSTPVATTSVMASTYATQSGVPLVSDILSAKNSSVSSSPPSATQTMIQHVIPSSTEDFLRQTTDGPSNSNIVNLDGKIKS